MVLLALTIIKDFNLALTLLKKQDDFGSENAALTMVKDFKLEK